MSGASRPQSGASGRQSWTPEQLPRGVTCPACGLANEAGARVCRNCGLPIASATDPLRGVRASSVELAGRHRSGVSATLGLAMVVALLLIGGTLAVSGGGILSGGGRLGVEPETSASPGAADPGAQASLEPGTPLGPASSGEPGDETPAAVGTSFDYTCENAAIRDISKSRWNLSQFRVGQRLSDEGNYDRITWEMTRRGDSKAGTVVSMEWTTPQEAKRKYGATLVSGQRAIVVTFDGPVDIPVGQEIDSLQLEPEGVVQMRTVDMFEDEDGTVRTVIGLRGESCARMSANGWSRKSNGRAGRVYLDVEKS